MWRFPWPALCGVSPILCVWQRRCCNYLRASATYRKLDISNVSHYVSRSASKFKIHKYFIVECFIFSICRLFSRMTLINKMYFFLFLFVFRSLSWDNCIKEFTVYCCPYVWKLSKRLARNAVGIFNATRGLIAGLFLQLHEEKQFLTAICRGRRGRGRGRGLFCFPEHPHRL